MNREDSTTCFSSQRVAWAGASAEQNLQGEGRVTVKLSDPEMWLHQPQFLFSQLPSERTGYADFYGPCQAHNPRGYLIYGSILLHTFLTMKFRQ